MLFSLWRHENDLRDSQLQNGKVKEDALTPCWEASRKTSMLHGSAGALFNRSSLPVMPNRRSVAVVLFLYMHVDILTVSRSFASDHWSLSHSFVFITALFSSSSCVTDCTDFLRASVICHVIAHYQAVSILRALIYLGWQISHPSPWRTQPWSHYIEVW